MAKQTKVAVTVTRKGSERHRHAGEPVVEGQVIEVSEDAAAMMERNGTGARKSDKSSGGSGSGSGSSTSSGGAGSEETQE